MSHGLASQVVAAIKAARPRTWNVFSRFMQEAVLYSSNDQQRTFSVVSELSSLKIHLPNISNVKGNVYLLCLDVN